MPKMEDDDEAKRERVVQFDYTNWRGEHRRRTVRPVRLFFGQSEYHNTHGRSIWFLDGVDLERAILPGGEEQHRHFKLSDISNWVDRPGPPGS